MRRLTKFEKEIVTKIYESELNGVDFSEIFWIENFTDFIFKISIESVPNDIVFQVNLYSNQPVDSNVPNGDENLRKYYREFKKLFDALNLIYLLEENGFLYLDTDFYNKSPFYLPYVSKSTIVESDLSGILINENNIQSLYHNIILKDITRKDFEIFVNTLFQPSAALEIYVQNGFRTEEQKHADESIAHNEETREQAEEATRIAHEGVIAANVSAKQARNAVWATVLLGLLALGYSALRDYKKDQDELNSQTLQAEAKKQEDRFHDKMVKRIDKLTEAVDGIRKDFKPAPPTK